MHGGDCHDFVNEALGGVCNALHSCARRKCKQKKADCHPGQSASSFSLQTAVVQRSRVTPVLDWITGTALTQVKGRLTEEAWQQYRQAIIPLLAEAYPARPDGITFFPFRRVFVVARV